MNNGNAMRGCDFRVFIYFETKELASIQDERYTMINFFFERRSKKDYGKNADIYLIKRILTFSFLAAITI